MDFENKILSKEISQFIWEKVKLLGRRRVVRVEGLPRQ